jgi:hypothetical protein
MKRNHFALLLWGAVLTGCSVDLYNTEAVKEAVVDGCLISGRAINKIRLTDLVPYGSDLDSFSPITGALLAISTSDSTWPLSYSGDSGFYQSPDTLRSVQEGETYTLRGEYNGKSFWASTTVPGKPSGLALSDTVMNIDSARGFPGGPDTTGVIDTAGGPPSGPGGMPGMGESLTLSFDNPEGAYHYVVIENVDPHPVEIQSDTFKFQGMRFLSTPFTADFYTVTSMQIKQYGRHKITLYQVNQEYADLYENRTQDSRNLTEPKTNVHNGLGIFTAVNCDSVFFEVKASP